MLEALPVVPVKVGTGAKLRVLPQPVYDSELTGTSAISQVVFFATALGGSFQNTSGTPDYTRKTLADTNIRQTGQLGSPLEFDMVGFNLKLQPAVTTTPAVITPADFTQLYKNGWFEFAFNNRPFLQIPIEELPHGNGASGFNGVTTAAAGNQMPHVGVGHRSNIFKYLVGKYRVRIRSTENFSATLNWNAAITQSITWKVTLLLQGFLYNAI